MQKYKAQSAVLGLAFRSEEPCNFRISTALRDLLLQLLPTVCCLNRENVVRRHITSFHTYTIQRLKVTTSVFGCLYVMMFFSRLYLLKAVLFRTKILSVFCKYLYRLPMTLLSNPLKTGDFAVKFFFNYLSSFRYETTTRGLPMRSSIYSKFKCVCKRWTLQRTAHISENESVEQVVIEYCPPPEVSILDDNEFC
jgi:hypothetical protein